MNADSNRSAVESNASHTSIPLGFAPEIWARIQDGSMSHDDFADAIFEAIEKLPAQLTDEEVKEADARIRADHFGPARRLALLVLAKPGSWLLKTLESCQHSEALAFAKMADSMVQYADDLEDLAELVRSSGRKIQTAMCGREDAQEIFERAGSFRPETAQPAEKD